MAKKKPDPTPSKLIGLRLEVTEAERDLIRIAAAKAGERSMAQWLRKVVIEAAQKDAGRKP